MRVLNLDHVERDYVRWYPTALGDFSSHDAERSLRAHTGVREKGLYLHIPYCDKKCAFCNYNVVIKDHTDAAVQSATAAYVNSIKEHLLTYVKRGWFRDVRINSLYVGGGTPSFLTAPELHDLIAFCTSTLDFTPDAEISIEANPISVDTEKFAAMKAAGATRVSIGVQSFEPRLLDIMGRGVTREENIRAIQEARRSGLRIVNIDLIYRNPSQTTAELLESIDMAIGLGVNQISLYPLWVRPKTEFHHSFTRRKLTLPTQADEFQQLVHAQERFGQLGFEQYNVFDFVDDRANVCINTYHQWEDGEWLGIGPGATSYFGGSFFIHTYDTANYIARLDKGEDTVNLGLTLTERERMERTMVFGLRMFPFRKRRFRDRYGVDVQSVFPQELDLLEKQGLLSNEEEVIRLTSLGIFHVNGISKLFYSKHRRDSLQPLGINKDGGQILEKDL